MKHKLKVEMSDNLIRVWVNATGFDLGPQQIEFLAEQRTGGTLHVALGEKMELVERALEATLACVRDTDELFAASKEAGVNCVELPSLTAMKKALRDAGVLS